MIKKTKLSRAGIAYEERGPESGLPFIALHGYSLDRRMSIGAFEPLFEAAGQAMKSGLSGRGYRRIYPDLPFMGESTDEPLGSGHDGMLAAMSGFVSEIAREEPFLLAGESYGGYLSRALAREFGDRVAGLFLLCPAIVTLRERRELPKRQVLRTEKGWLEAAKDSGAEEADIAAYREHAVVESRVGFERFRAEILAGIKIARLSALSRYLKGSEAFSFDCIGREGSAWEPFDPVYKGPTCFFLGRQDSSVGWRDALRLCDRYPRASYHIVDAAGHNAQVDQAEVFAAAFDAWLADCEAG